MENFTSDIEVGDGISGLEDKVPKLKHSVDNRDKSNESIATECSRYIGYHLKTSSVCHGHRSREVLKLKGQEIELIKS